VKLAFRFSISIALLLTGCAAFAQETPTPVGQAASQPIFLWDVQQPRPWSKRPSLSAVDLQHITGIVKKYTGSPEPVRITSALNGHFVAEYPGEQTLIAIAQSDSRRSMMEGDWGMLALYSGSTVKLLRAEVGGDLLKVVRVPGASVDYVLVNSEGSAQGDNRDYFRLVSISGFRFQIVQEIGMARYDDCFTGEPTGIVADRLSIEPQSGGLKVIRLHFFSACGRGSSFRFIGSDGNDAEAKLIRLRGGQR
jgi:hypothetical protein